MRSGGGKGRHISQRSSSEQVGVSAALGAEQETAEEDERRSAPKKRSTGYKASRDERQRGLKLM